MKAKASGMPAKFEATPAERGEQRLDEARAAAVDGRVGDEQPEQAAADGADHADLDAGDEGGPVLAREQGPDVLEGEPSAWRW